MLTTLFTRPGSIKPGSRLPVIGILIILVTGYMACKKNEVNAVLNGYEQTNLVADVTGFGAAFVDSSLINAWGIAVAPSGPFWISANNAGLSTIYSKTGEIGRAHV